ncbi:MAG TPA: hypothetical protein VI685_02405 [Candidatus Angelobacter sp.]
MPLTSAATTGSLYDCVDEQLRELVHCFHLGHRLEQILKAYQTLCSESLAMPLGRPVPGFSRINEDGTPFQYALITEPERASPLQFLSEAGVPGASMMERMALSRDRIRSLCSVLGTTTKAEEVLDLLDHIAPVSNPDLLADDAGAFWIGVSFAIDGPPKLIAYINGKWGSEDARWARLDDFADRLDARQQWQAVKMVLSRQMKPLGMALTVSQDRSLQGRIYVSAYGESLGFYEQVAQGLGGTRVLALLNQFTEIMLGDDRQYPTRSAVCSFGLNHRSEPDFKFELCGHCMFGGDRDAVAKCSRWLASLNSAPAHYEHLLRVLAPGPLSPTHVHLHSYVGVGWRAQESYGTIYLKPG